MPAASATLISRLSVPLRRVVVQLRLVPLTKALRLVQLAPLSSEP